MLQAPGTVVPTRTTLVVDDEKVVRSVVRRFLERRGWCVLEAETAEGALEMVAVTGQQFDLVLCDLNLPGMSGSSLCGRIVAMRPELATRIVMTSGDPHAAMIEMARASLDFPLLEKPFSLADLDRLVVGTALVA